MSIYPKEYSIEDFNKTQQMREGNVIRVDTSEGKCVGVFKSLKDGFPSPHHKFWNLTLSPKYFVKDKKVSAATNISSDFMIVSPFKRITVLASDMDTWDKKQGLFDQGGPSSRRSSNEDIPRDTLNRTSSGISLGSLGSVSPITTDDMKSSREFPSKFSPRTKVEMQSFQRTESS